MNAHAGHRLDECTECLDAWYQIACPLCRCGKLVERSSEDGDFACEDHYTA